VVVAAVLVGAGLAIWSVSRGARSPAPPSAGRHSTAPAAAAAVLLKPVSASSFDVLGNDGGNEDSGGAHYVLDGSPGQYWHTDYYLGSPAFGNLKKGTGLILDMGKQVRLSQVVVQFGATCCAHAQIEIGNDASPAASTLGSFTALQSSSRARRSTTFDVTKNATGRYVLIWLTYLPPRDGYAHQYQALIYHVTVHGSVASQSG
jgi:hypothetical protein